MEILLREGDLEEVVDDPADLGLGEAQFDEVIDGGVDPPLPCFGLGRSPRLGFGRTIASSSLPSLGRHCKGQCERSPRLLKNIQKKLFHTASPDFIF
jgi:hypothetical protein